MITLIVGSTGAGKTTYARRIASDQMAVVYSIDNWMKLMFGADMPEDPEPFWFYANQSWYVERIGRCEEMIKALAAQRAKLKQSSLLDLGFSTKEHRKHFIDFFQNQGIEVSILFLNVPAAVRRQRVEKRNSEKGETFVMTVDESLFNYMENLFEIPTTAEGVSVRVVSESESG